MTDSTGSPTSSETTPEETPVPGRYDSPLVAYPGYIRFRHPFTDGAYRAFWDAYHQYHTTRPENDYVRTDRMCNWRGARAVIVEWDIEGVPPAAMTEMAETVPAEVVTWVVNVLGEYMRPFVRYGSLLASPLVTPQTRQANSPHRGRSSGTNVTDYLASRFFPDTDRY